MREGGRARGRRKSFSTLSSSPPPLLRARAGTASSSRVVGQPLPAPGRRRARNPPPEWALAVFSLFSLARGEKRSPARLASPRLASPLPFLVPSVAPLMLMISFSSVRRCASNWAAWDGEGRMEKERGWLSAEREGGPSRARRAASLSSLRSLLISSLPYLLQHELVALVGGRDEGGGEHARRLADL